MIKNVALKKFLSGTVFQGISALNRAVPVRDDVILLYCNMEFRDNIRYLISADACDMQRSWRRAAGMERDSKCRIP